MSVALVTGSTRGLGLATAIALAQRGDTVIVSGRDEGRVDAARATAGRASEVTVHGVALDVTDDASIAAATTYIGDTFGHLDILINNAGILPEALDPQRHEFASVDQFRTTFETNVFGVVAVTEALLPLLRSSAGARIVNVSSTVGSLAAQSNPASPWYAMLVPGYQSSKAALNSITIERAKSLADTSIIVTSVCPGWVQTELAPGNRENAPLTAEQAATVVVEAAHRPAGSPTGTFVDAVGPVLW